MPPLFEELDWSPTPIGPVSLRRRRDLRTGEDVYEVKLGEEFLMSSQFTVSEIALARSGLALCEGDALDVVVGGLGLGYTAVEALADPRLRSLTIVEYLEPVIGWHRNRLLPLGETLCNDPRARFVPGDFFAMSAGDGFDPDQPGRRFDAILLDIDHSPEALLDTRSDSFYTPQGLTGLARHLAPRGVFGLWSNERPDEHFTERLAGVFDEAQAQIVRFYNPLQDNEAVQCVYLGRRRDG
ncbi:MAG: spermidine synthase [Salinarimonas sp.]|nr:spermidine synthase [Salinarimonas sp.]